MPYTKDQLLAINESNKNILVSAGAGSGKTSVLKARVIEKLNKGVHIDDLIILTFTKAAANEMKSRIVEAITQNNNLKSELPRVNQAIITTFDAFCLKLVKEYHYLLDLPANITIGDKNQFLTMEKTCLEETIKDYYLKNDKDFNNLVLDYFQKGDDLIYTTISNLSKKVSKYPNAIKLLNDFENLYLTDNKLDEYYNDFENKLIELMNLAKSKFVKFEDNLSNQTDSIDKYIADYRSILQSSKTGDEILNVLQNANFPRKPSIRNNPDLKELLDYYNNPFKSVIDELKGIVKDLNIVSKEMAISRVKSTKGNVLKLVEITKEYLINLRTLKKQRNLYSYQDIMDLSINLLENNQSIVDLYKQKINEIMVDEYQDTNDLQVYFINLIANNNLFMVGDIKQSIYGFRDANPKNFLEKYNSYSQKNGGMLIKLRENFRSRKSILDDINVVFNQTMDEVIGGINYQDNQSLVYGNTSYDNKYPNQHYGIELHKYDLETLKEENPDLDSVTVEANLLAKDISNKISSKYQIYDFGFRDIRYSDIVVLVDRKTNFQTMSKILSSQNIPVNLYSDEPFISSVEMLFITNFLRLTNCFIDKDYLKENFKSLFYSVARSFVFKVKDQEIINFIANENITRIEDLIRLDDYVVFGGIYNICLEISKLIDTLPVIDITKLIYKKLDIYKQITYLDNPRIKEEKLDFFLETVSAFENFDYQDLIEYLDNIKDTKDLDIEYSKQASNIETISIMTMHKSKGLQYPVVYCTGLSKRFNYTENKDFFMFDLNYGLIGQANDQGFTHTFLRTLSLDKSKQDYISERIRLLYVAFTRAKENLILFSDIKDLPEDKDILEGKYIDNRIRLKYSKFTDLLASTNIRNYSVNNQFNDIDNFVNSIDLDESKSVNLELKKLNFNKTKSKEVKYSKSELSLFNDEVISSIEYGNEVHKQLEDFDFTNIENSLLKLPNQLRHSYKTLLESELFDFNKNIKVLQEFEFIENNSHGIIDLLIEYDDLFIIVDYKLKSIEDSAYKKQLLGYKEYLKTKSNKTINCYLYSIIDETLVKVD